VSTSGGSR